MSSFCWIPQFELKCFNPSFFDRSNLGSFLPWIICLPFNSALYVLRGQLSSFSTLQRCMCMVAWETRKFRQVFGCVTAWSWALTTSSASATFSTFSVKVSYRSYDGHLNSIRVTPSKLLNHALTECPFLPYSFVIEHKAVIEIFSKQIH